MKLLISIGLCVLVVVACSQQMTEGNRDGSNASTNSVNFTNGSTALQSRLVIDCPVGLVNGLTLDEEFGLGTSEITKCLDNHQEVNVVYAINKACRSPDCGMAYGLHNIANAITDYEITNGLVLHRDYDISAVFYASGSLLLVDNNAVEPYAEINPFQDMVEELMDNGVHVYLCQNSARHMGIVTANLIPGVKYVTSGVTALADFQLSEYAIINP